MGAKGTVTFGLVCAVAAIAAYGRSSSMQPPEPEPYGPPLPPTNPTAPVLNLPAGVYWTFVSWTQVADIADFFSREMVTLHGVFGDPIAGTHAMLVFEALEPVAWTLPFAVYRAPKGVDTQPEDVFATTPVTPEWRRWMEERAAAALDVLREYDQRLQRWLTEQLYGGQ